MKLIIAKAIVFFSLSVIPVLSISMSIPFFSKQEIVVFSPLSGQLTFEGAPAKGAILHRELRWDGGEKNEVLEVTTDENGYFNLPERTDKISLSPLAELVINQSVKVFYNKKEYVIWICGKGKPGKFTEIGTEPKDLSCELTVDWERVESDGGMLGTSCKWK